MKQITLTREELKQASWAGCLRQIENIGKNRTPHNGTPQNNDWQLHIQGCMGEFVVAKFLDIEWNGKGKFRDYDVGNFEVRTTSDLNGGLRLYKKDKPDSIFWHVRGINGTYIITGWIRASEGMKNEYWQKVSKYGSWMGYVVPVEKLNDPDDLRYKEWQP